MTEKEELVNNSDTAERTAESAKEEELSEGMGRDEECMLVELFLAQCSNFVSNHKATKIYWPKSEF